MNFSFENKINKIIFHQQGNFLFVNAGVERLIRSSATSRADELKILEIKFLIYSLIFSLYKENEHNIIYFLLYISFILSIHFLSICERASSVIRKAQFPFATPGWFIFVSLPKPHKS